MTTASRSADPVVDRAVDPAAAGAHDVPEGATPGADRTRDLVALGEFGLYDELADDAHAQYVDGFSERAVEVARRHLALTRAAGDVTTSRYLRYITAIALQDLGRHQEAVAEAIGLADELGRPPRAGVARQGAVGGRRVQHPAG